MYNAMMDPEMIRLAQEQMGRMSPTDLAKMQQQMMSNPELIRLASESMKNMRPEDIRNAAEQLKHARVEDMAEISEKMAKATPEELAAIRARADAHGTYELNAAQMLKKQGNDLHSQGRFRDAAQKYLHAKNNLKNVPVTKGRTLQLACSLNLMSCYLKTRQYEDCINEGSEVLAYDAENVKALYRRGQAYKELGNLEAAIPDLSKAHEVSPDDETIADVLRDANEKGAKGGAQHVSQGVIIEEITEEEIRPTQSECDNGSSPTEYSVTQLQDGGECSQSQGGSNIRGPTDAEPLQGLKDKPEAIRSFREFVSSVDPDALAAISSGEVSSDMVNTASDMIRKMSPEDLQKIIEIASSSNGKGPPFPLATTEGSTSGLQPPGISPSMVKTASDMISKMSPEELQKMLEVASSLNEKDPFSSPATSSGNNSQRSKTRSSGECSRSQDGSSIHGTPTDTECLQGLKDNPEAIRSFCEFVSNANPDSLASLSAGGVSPDMAKTASDIISKMSPQELQKMLEIASSFNGKGPPFPMATTDTNSKRSREKGIHAMNEDLDMSGSSFRGFTNSTTDLSPSNFPASTADLQEQMRNQMNDPAMKQMFTSMIKNMSPDMMANMSEQFGVKLTREEAAKAQQAMSSMSPEDLDKMMRWADRLNTAVNSARKTKNWLLGRPGMILAICMLVLAMLLHRLGHIGG